jgi:hypothetical protein
MPSHVELAAALLALSRPTSGEASTFGTMNTAFVTVNTMPVHASIGNEKAEQK